MAIMRRTRSCRDLDAFATKLHLTRFVLAGNSMGGGIAARYAMLHPEHLAGLVLVDAAGAPVKREGGGNLAFTIARIPVLGRLSSQFLPRALVAKSLHQTVKNQAVVTPAAIDRYWELGRYPGNRDATIARFSHDMTTYTPQQVAAIRTPTLVMWGTDDPLLPFAGGKWYAAHLPNAKLAAYPGIGHLPMEEAADRSAADLAKFVDGLAAPPG